MASSLIRPFARMFPSLGDDLYRARMKGSAEEYLKKVLRISLAVSVVLSLLLAIVLPELGYSVWWAVVSVPVLFFGFLMFFVRVPHVYIIRQKKEIDKNVLFAGRYILIKIESGIPLYNVLEGVSQSFGATGHFFKDIVRFIELGDSLDGGLDRAVRLCPSDDLRKILWELSNTIKTGTDIKKSMKAILLEIHEEYVIAIEKYGKKLNSLTLMYMVIGIIAPSLGLTMFVVLSSFIAVEVPFTVLMAVLFFLAVLQFMFISIFRSIRPSVDI